MPLRPVEQNYRERVSRVVAAIVADPMAEHRLEDLARLANFSPFHFHRVYHGIAGETVAATVRRVRLALATHLLTRSDESITQVALAVGYESPQAFTRAFGQFAGQAPREFQRQMREAILDAAPALQDRGTGTSPSVRIVERRAQPVHALRHRGPFSTIPHTHRRLRAHAAGRAVSDWLGISCGAPDAPSDFRYYAAAASPDPWLVDETEIELLDIPGGLYAVHGLAGPYTRINAAVHALYAQWLPGSGYEPDDRPTLEHYLNSPRQVAPAALRTDLLIPIRKAG
ncbi:AraC family transcriptional regulator [Variovorax sp. Root411]|uniref:AraC family transcriptional regulator n=1 Tax=Variovorax sp. Root411 TaxID=1736530 RepID=UPI0007021291|nr:GyrI-like domain-containing protein [Variovorax sp. Root411]KQW57125.1 AraC family transcriptional regulator [Variovorax sp. Root411]